MARCECMNVPWPISCTQMYARWGRFSIEYFGPYSVTLPSVHAMISRSSSSMT